MKWMEPVATHYSMEYVDMVYRFMKNRQEAQRFWRQFRRLGEEYQLADLAVERSLELQQEFHAVPRACYYNAATIALSMPSVFDYMEGIATSVIPTEHAWLVDRTMNRVVDPTWILGHRRARKPEHKIKDYYGVRVPLVIVREIVTHFEVAGPLLWLCMDQLKVMRRRKGLIG